MTGIARSAFRLAAVALSLAALPHLISEAVAVETSDLYGTCFAAWQAASPIPGSPSSRVAAIAVQFQGFENTLLASASYTLRYGTSFSFSAECNAESEGSFSCRSCVNDNCETNGEAFQVIWSGGDGLHILNDTTGMLAENAAGGRDYLLPTGQQETFLLYRTAAENCAW
jgi:hypothetical protein